MNYAAERAIILAAGVGSRLAPVTLDRPKPLVRVNGVRIIDTIIDSLVEAEIEDITIVRGYKKECFDELLEKYPFLQFIDNELYETTNSISSARAAMDKLHGGCYICEADLLVRNPEVIHKYHTSSDYLGSYVKETDDWCLEEKNGRATPTVSTAMASPSGLRRIATSSVPISKAYGTKRAAATCSTSSSRLYSGRTITM